MNILDLQNKNILPPDLQIQELQPDLQQWRATQNKLSIIILSPIFYDQNFQAWTI